ncbi:kinase-like domain-containing protein [Mortierella sp. GBAus27b]|nr:kinase-like domain-containing protein [Mortierella sp. GBAus27b]
MNQCGQHDNIVQFYGVAIRSNEEHRGERYMIMQYYEHGDLVKLVETPQHLPEAPTLTDKMYLALDIAQGLHHLFKCGYHHGDLHPKNILIDLRRGATAHQGRYLARLTDFGLRRKRDNLNAFSSQQFGGVWQFMAPERMVKKRPRFDVRCDVFALGVIFWFIMAGRYPFKDPGMFSPGAREGRIDGTPDWYYDVYTKAWSEDPNARQQSLEEIIQVFRHHLGIQTPLPASTYLDPGNPYPAHPPTSYGYDGSTFQSYVTHDGQPHHYSGSSAGSSTIRGSPLLTPASMLTPTFSGQGSPHPPSPLMSNSSSTTSSQRPSYPRNSRPNIHHNGIPSSIYRQPS